MNVLKLLKMGDANTSLSIVYVFTFLIDRWYSDVNQMLYIKINGYKPQ